MRCENGIWPPSNPRRKPSLRAFWPFWPRPEVLSRPEPVPRRMRRALRCAPAAGLRSWSCIWSVSSLVFLVRARPPDLVPAALGPQVRLSVDRDQERDRLQHAPHRRVVGKLAGLVEAAEAKRFDPGPHLRLGADFVPPRLGLLWLGDVKSALVEGHSGHDRPGFYL